MCSRSQQRSLAVCQKPPDAKLDRDPPPPSASAIANRATVTAMPTVDDTYERRRVHDDGSLGPVLRQPRGALFERRQQSPATCVSAYGVLMGDGEAEVREWTLPSLEEEPVTSHRRRVRLACPLQKRCRSPKATIALRSEQ